MNKTDIKTWFENKLIEYQEEITSKWSTNSERSLASIKYDHIIELKNKLKEEGLI